MLRRTRQTSGFVNIQATASAQPHSPVSDTSSSIPFLTLQSTGTHDSSYPAPSRKSRPQPAFYPNVNAMNKEQKPFSRSAAKRDSVTALGSIEHLQHYFTKTGLITKKEYVTLSLSPPSHNREHYYPGPSRETAFLRMDPSMPPTPKTPR